ncbi:hypothetical protein HJC23_009730 [Cyclotella cryptica]|uniref:Disease resistance R13L4/SHOC-2-like LRR domain-containing protein n=1 Tax=Cyclotella cryptica TaxID=29204 RepID=A0ABD3NXR7_9STRA
MSNQPATRYRTVLDQLNYTPKFTTEWFRQKEEEVQLRSHPDCADLVDNSQVDDLQLSEGNNEKISASDSDERETNTSEDRPSRGRFTFTSSSSQQEANSGGEEQEGNNLNAIANHLPTPFCAGSNATESDPPNSNEREEGKQTPSPPSHDFKTEHKQIHSNVAVVTEAALVLDSVDHELPPLPVNLHSQTCDGWHKTKMVEGIVTHSSINDEGPSLPLNVTWADLAITEKLSGVDAATRLKSDQSDSSVVHPPPVAESNHSNLLDQALLAHVQQARAEFPEVHINYEPHLSPRVSQRYDGTPSASSDVPSQSRPSGPRHEEEEILIPEAFPVEANAPAEVTDVEVAELFEPDQSTFRLKKHHACIALTLFAAVAIALGATVYFTRDTSPSIGSAKETLMSTPSSQPTSLLPSTQPSFIQPSSQPSQSVKGAIEKNVLKRNVTFDELEDTDARVFALDWLNNEDTTLVTSDQNLFQRYILVLLAFEYSNLGWLSDVKSDGNECSWLGVVCDEDGLVIKLMLDDNRLDGTIPPEIGSLQSLQMLSMSGNSLSETLPHELGSLRNMSELYLNYNHFTGPLPSEILNLTKLTVLDLSVNNITGTLPLELGNLKKLKSLSLEDNWFNGTLPLELGNLKKLKSLSLKDNWFNGTLPSELGYLVELNALDLSWNVFSGTLPPRLCDLNNLAEIDFSGNHFSGTLPSELGNLSNLTQLRLTSNYIEGPLPSELGSLNMLNVVYLDHNDLVGTLPSEFGNLKKLAEIDLYSNELTGTVPSQLGNLIELTKLDISQNLLEGTLPTELGNLKRLEEFEVNENKLSGTVPSELGQLNMAWKFWLFLNKFSGTLPSELAQLTSVYSFWVYSNQFTGTLPSWIGDLPNLRGLYVGGNQFVGTLPSELGLLNLEYFGVDKNKFTGTLPAWIGYFRDLGVLWINNNQFTGTFPPEIENNLNLHDFCAKSNNFSGPVPRDIEDWYTCYE